MSNDVPLVSAIIPCRNETSWIAKCLESIVGNDYPKDRIEVLVVDGMSDDGTRAIVEDLVNRYPFIRLLENPKKTAPAALNIGIAAAQGEVIMRMDAHNEYPSHYISGLVHWLQKSGADNVGGMWITRPSEETCMAQAIALGCSHPFGVGNARYRLGVKEPRLVDTVPFGCYRRDVFDRVGMFDEELVRNQDIEFNLRLRNAGGSILLVPEVASYYHARDTLRKLWHTHYQNGYFNMLVVRKMKGHITFRQAIPPLFVLLLLITALLAPFSKWMLTTFACVLLAYLVPLVVHSTIAAWRHGWRTGLSLAMVFLTLHFSNGFGSLKGALDFFIRRKRITTTEAKDIPITRSSRRPLARAEDAQMNILLINHYAGSTRLGMEYRPFYIAREWVRLGHRVTIVGASFSHLRHQQPEVEHNVVEEDIEGIRYVWLKTPRYTGNNIRRMINVFAFTAQLWRYQDRIIGNHPPNAVIASSPHPLAVIPARRIAYRHGASLIFEVRDLWPLTLIELKKMSKWHPFIWCLKYAENYAYRHCDRTVCTLPKAEPYMRAHGLKPDSFVFIPNGICLEDWADATRELPETHSATLAQLKQRYRILIGYLGQHGSANSLDAFIEAAPLVAKENAALVLVGQGPEKKRLQAKAAQLGVDNVVFLSPVSKETVPAVLESMDILFLGWQRKPLYRFGISPNKLMDYMMAAKPVIHAVEAGNDPVAESGCGISCRPEDPQAIADAVKKLMRRSPEEKLAMGQQGKDYILQHHDYSILASRLLDVLNGKDSNGS